MKQKRVKKKDRYPGTRFFAVTQIDIIETVKELARPLCDEGGVKLLHVEFQREPGGKTLRLYIDKAGGVKLDDCVNISRQLSDILDVNFETKGSYRLEVSSPGTEPPLQEKEEFKMHIGRTIKIRVSQPICGQKNIKGILKDVSEHTITLVKDGKTVAVPFSEMVRARLVENSGENIC